MTSDNDSQPGPVWDLFCSGDYVYSTRDPLDAASWVDADPAQHTTEQR